MSRYSSLFLFRCWVILTVIFTVAVGIHVGVTPWAMASKWLPWPANSSPSETTPSSSAPITNIPVSSELPEWALAVQNNPELANKDGAIIETQQGKIIIRFYEAEAPLTVANFKRLVQQGFYNTSGMVFHRVVKDFVIQTGDPTGTGFGGSPNTIPLEVKNKLVHDSIGVVAMARGPLPDSATSQFYITLTKQTPLDGKYAIFAEVIDGLDVLTRIQAKDKVYGIQLATLNTVSPAPAYTPRKAYGKQRELEARKAKRAEERAQKQARKQAFKQQAEAVKIRTKTQQELAQTHTETSKKPARSNPWWKPF
ncbi:MAG: peptidylprolyl isomerase [Vampirovibrionales bacterium]